MIKPTPPVLPKKPLKPWFEQPHDSFNRVKIDVPLMSPAEYDEDVQYYRAVKKIIPGKKYYLYVPIEMKFSDLERLIPEGVSKDDISITVDASYSDHDGSTELQSIFLTYDIINESEQHKIRLKTAEDEYNVWLKDYEKDIIDFDNQMEVYQEEMAKYLDLKKQFDIFELEQKIAEDNKNLAELKANVDRYLKEGH